MIDAMQGQSALTNLRGHLLNLRASVEVGHDREQDTRLCTLNAWVLIVHSEQGP